MLNQFVVVGKVKEVPEIKTSMSGNKYSNMLVEVTRSFKNSENVFESDTLSFILWRGVAESCVDTCKAGSIIGIKGRIQTKEHKTEEGQIFYNYDLVAEKVSFIQNGE